MYQQQSQLNEYSSQVHLEDLDYANFILSELKRSAREYTTAALEAANPGIRQTFETLLQKTLDDQAIIFQEIQKLGGYEIQPAQQQMIQKELQKMSQTALRVQSLVQAHEGSTSTESYDQQERSAIQASIQQQIQQHQPYTTYAQPTTQQQSYQQPQQNEVAALHQAPTPTPFQPVNYANQYTNAAYNQQNQQNQQSQQGIGAGQHQSQPSSYSQTPSQGRGYQNQGQDQVQSSYGRETQSQGYAAASSNQPGGNMGSTGRPAQARIIARNQPGTHSASSDEGRNRPQHGGKYSF